MSAIYTLVLAQQQVQPLEDSPKARVITWLCFLAGLVIIFLGTLLTRPKKTGHRVTKKSSSLSFEWLPVAAAHLRHKIHPAERTGQSHSTE